MATSYESFYDGAANFLEPTYGASAGFSGPNLSQQFSASHFQISGARLGFPGMFNTANQLGQAIEVIKNGVKAFEVTTLGLQGEDIVPMQHYDEIRALTKLAGVKASIHGPLIDPAGFGEKGWGGEEQREENERRMYDAMIKAQKLTPRGLKPDGTPQDYTVPIVFHASSGWGGNQWIMEDGKKVLQQATMVNQETGQLQLAERQFKFRPTDLETLDKEGKKGKLFSVESQIGSANASEWENRMTELASFTKHADELINPGIAAIEREQSKEPAKRDFGALLAAEKQMKKADIFLENVELNFQSTFHKAYKYGDNSQRVELKQMAERYREDIGKLKSGEYEVAKIEKKIEEAKNKEEAAKYELERLKIAVNLPTAKKDIYENYIGKLNEITEGGEKAPQTYTDGEELAKKEGAITFGNLAFQAYRDFTKNKKLAPMIAIENLPENMAFNDAQQVRDMIENSRKHFVERLVKDERMNKSQAEKLAEKQIGATWDVGHTNTLKKRGFVDDNIITETRVMTDTHEGHDHGQGKKNIVKHVHLTDNFGFSDSHMALGQGNVPLSRIMQELQKTGQVEKMNHIIESGAFISQFRKSPLMPSLTAIASPIYSMKGGPSFNQLGAMTGSYLGGMGNINPEGHHSLYGAGFSSLPLELGGQMQGAGSSRFGGTPMA